MSTASFLYQKLVDRSTLRQGFSIPVEYHRIVHVAKPTFNYRTLSFDFPNGLSERVQLNKHLQQA